MLGNQKPFPSFLKEDCLLRKKLKSAVGDSQFFPNKSIVFKEIEK